jgi:sugar phosphate isomerase/epimerase
MSIPFVGCRAPSGRRCGTLGVMNLLTVTLPREATESVAASAAEHFRPFAEKMGAQLVVTVEGVGVHLAHDPSALHARLDRLCDAIEGLVAVAAASLPDEPSEPDDGIPQPLGRPR